MNSKNLLIISVRYKPFIGIVKDGCTLKNVHFLIIETREKIIYKVLFCIFQLLGFHSIAMKCKLSKESYRSFKMFAKQPECKFLFWGQHFVKWWYSLGKMLPKSSKMCFCWGPLENTNELKKRISFVRKMMSDGISFFTMNPYDAEKYGMKLTSQVYRYFDEIKPDCEKTDFYFLGFKKGREKILGQIKTLLQKKGFTVNFNLIEHNVPECPFIENVRMASESRCIVDVVASDSIYKQNGPSLRPLEALFLQKKLITNYSSIKECDFYHPNNVFIFDDEKINFDEIESFMRLPFCKVDDEIVKQYEVNRWIARNFME